MGSRKQNEDMNRSIQNMGPTTRSAPVSSAPGESKSSETNQVKTKFDLPDAEEWKEIAAKEREKVRKAEKSGETKTVQRPDGKEATFRGDKGAFPDCNAEMSKRVRGSSGYGTLTGVTERFVMSGRWKNGMLDGFGSHLDSDGSWYEGGWKNGQANGCGRKIFQDGSTYFGEWAGGNFHGFGRREWSDGTSYEGEWLANMKHGEGEHVDAYYNIWEGEWRFDKLVDGSVLENRNWYMELWRDGKPVGDLPPGL